GKRNGLTTKLSVVSASPIPPTERYAASLSVSPTVFAIKRGTMSPSTRRRLAFPPAPCAMSICASRNVGVPGAVSVAISAGGGARSAVNVAEISGARALGRNHERADRQLGRAFAGEQLALVWFQHAFEDFAALRRFRICDGDARYLKACFGIPHGIV